MTEIKVQRKLPLRKKCRNTEFFLVRIFLYSVQIQDTDQEILHIWTLFTQCTNQKKKRYKPERILKIINKKYTESKQSIISFKMSEYVLKVCQLLVPKKT